MANNLVTPVKVMKTVGLSLVNDLKFPANVNRTYDDQFQFDGCKVGYTVNARLPQRFRVNKGAGLNPQAVNDPIVPITITDQANVGIEFSSAALTMEIDDYARRYVDRAVEALSGTLSADGFERCYAGTHLTVGTPGVVPGSTGTLPQSANNVYLEAGVKLTEGGVPSRQRIGMLTAQMHATLASSNASVFNPSAVISKQYRTGMVGGPVLGVEEWYQDESIATHTVGPLGGTAVTSGVPIDGATTLSTTGWTAAVGRRLNKGDVFQIAGVRSINPQTYKSTGRLMDFVVTADMDSDGTGAGTIQFSPPLIAAVPGTNFNPFATVSALPASGAQITVFNGPTSGGGSHANKETRQGLVYSQDAYALVMADLVQPQGVWASQRIGNKALGIAIRFVKDYDAMTDQSPARLDIMYGWKPIRAEMAVRVCS
jgi:hypothetical protein